MSSHLAEVSARVSHMHGSAFHTSKIDLLLFSQFLWVSAYDILILLCTDNASYLYLWQTSSAQHLYKDHSWKYIFNWSQDWFLLNSTSKFLPIYYFHILCKCSSSLEKAFGCFGLDSEKPMAKYLRSIICSTVSYRIMTNFVPGHPHNELPFIWMSWLKILIRILETSC